MQQIVPRPTLDDDLNQETHFQLTAVVDRDWIEQRLGPATNGQWELRDQKLELPGVVLEVPWATMQLEERTLRIKIHHSSKGP